MKITISLLVLFFCCCPGIVFIQLAVSIAWLIYDPPDVREVYPSPLQAVLTCKGSGHSLMISLMLIIFLVPLCTIYAFKTRKIPENFNEAKYIGFTMYSTCIVFLASIAIYFGTSNDYKIQSSSLCMCLSISASVVLACLFSPKVYLVIFQPYKNVRPRNNGGRSGVQANASGSSGGGTGMSGCEMVSSTMWV
jgi:7 transmembrane sweet-taste receptor of 3 GCPR